jgi:hypothetical protein
MAVWNYEVEETKEQFLRPLPRTTTDRGAVSSSVTFIDVTLVLIVSHNGWLQGCFTLVTKVTVCQLIIPLTPNDIYIYVVPHR